MPRNLGVYGWTGNRYVEGEKRSQTREIHGRDQRRRGMPHGTKPEKLLLPLGFNLSCTQICRREGCFVKY